MRGGENMGLDNLFKGKKPSNEDMIKSVINGKKLKELDKDIDNVISGKRK